MHAPPAPHITGSMPHSTALLHLKPPLLKNPRSISASKSCSSSFVNPHDFISAVIFSIQKSLTRKEWNMASISEGVCTAIRIFCFFLAITTCSHSRGSPSSYEDNACFIPLKPADVFVMAVFYFNISVTSFNVVYSPTFPGNMINGIFGNLLSSPVCQTGIPG